MRKTVTVPVPNSIEHDLDPDNAQEEWIPDDATAAAIANDEPSNAAAVDVSLLTAEQRALLRTQLAQQDAREAERLRDLAAETMRIAREDLEAATAKAAELEAEAEALDGKVRPKAPGPEPVRRAVRKVTLRFGADGVTEVPDEDKPKRPRKPKPPAEKPATKERAPRADGTVVATCALVKKAIKDLGGKGNKSSIRKQGDFTRESLDEVIKGDEFTTVGKGKGAGTTYKVA